MIIWWNRKVGSGTGGGGSSIDPGTGEVTDGHPYMIDGVPLVGTRKVVTNVFGRLTAEGVSTVASAEGRSTIATGESNP